MPYHRVVLISNAFGRPGKEAGARIPHFLSGQSMGSLWSPSEAGSEGRQTVTWIPGGSGRGE